MTVKISPSPRRQFVNASGVPYSGAKLFYYAAGTTTKQDTYTTSTGATPNTNPIVLDSSGRTPYGVWFTTGLIYKEVLAPSTDTDPPTSPIYTEDNISGINDIVTSTQIQWVASALTPTYLSTTSFSVPGDQTSELNVGRRLQLTTSGGTVYGYISTSAFVTVTTVTLVMDSGQVLDVGLSSFNWSILSGTNHAVPKLTTALWSTLGVVTTGKENFSATVTVASNTSTLIGAATSTNVDISGTTTITSHDTVAEGTIRWGRFTGILTLTHNATSLILPGGVSILTASGDTYIAKSLGSGNWIYLSYQRATGPNMPAGSLLDFAGTSVPVGFLGCDGSAVNRTTYAALFAAISTTWGVGDGSTTFNVPDFRRKATVGSGGSGTGTLGNAVGNTGGAETHTLITSEMPAHTHTVLGYANPGGGGGGYDGSGGGGAAQTSSSTGSGASHNNMQPSAVVLKIIKT